MVAQDVILRMLAHPVKEIPAECEPIQALGVELATSSTRTFGGRFYILRKHSLDVGVTGCKHAAPLCCDVILYVPSSWGRSRRSAVSSQHRTRGLSEDAPTSFESTLSRFGPPRPFAHLHPLLLKVLQAIVLSVCRLLH